MTTVKDIVLTAIHHKGLDQTRKEASELAENSLCSKAHILSIIRKVEKGEIVAATLEDVRNTINRK